MGIFTVNTNMMFTVIYSKYCYLNVDYYYYYYNDSK